MGGGCGGCLNLSRPLVSIHSQAREEREEENESLLSVGKVTDRAPQHEMVGFGMDAEEMSIAQPPRKRKDLQERLVEFPAERKIATVREVLDIPHHARSFMQRS